MSFGQFATNQDQQPPYGYSGSANQYFPNDIDLDTMPELLPCDVDEVIIYMIVL